MVDSGIKVCKSCDPFISDLEAKKLEFVIFRIEEYEDELKKKKAKRVVVDEVSEAGESARLVKEGKMEDTGSVPPEWARFSQKIQANHVRFGSCYVKYKTSDGRYESKLPFIYWCNDDCAKVTDKMTYSATKGTVHKKIVTATDSLQCCDSGCFEYDEIVARVKKLK